MFLRASGLASGATESSMSRNTWSESRPWAFSRNRGFDPGTAWQERRERRGVVSAGLMPGSVATGARPRGGPAVVGFVTRAQSTGASCGTRPRLLMITSAIPASITASPASAASGGCWPRITAASRAAPGTSSSSASETYIGVVVASRWLNTEWPSSCAVAVTSSSSPHCSSG